MLNCLIRRKPQLVRDTAKSRGPPPYVTERAERLT
jgi:hypothetical protein